MPAIVSSPYFCLFQLTSPAKAVYCIGVWQLGWEIHFQHAQGVKTFMRYWSLKTAVYHSQSAHVYPPGWCVALHRKKDTAGETGRQIIYHFHQTWKYLPLREASCLVFFFLFFCYAQKIFSSLSTSWALRRFSVRCHFPNKVRVNIDKARPRYNCVPVLISGVSCITNGCSVFYRIRGRQLFVFAPIRGVFSP